MGTRSFVGATLALLVVSAAPAIRGQDAVQPIPLPNEGAWRIGERWTDPAPRPEPWTPWPTDDPAIWAADACVGFYLTRDRAALAPVDIDEQTRPGWGPQLYAQRADPAARVFVLDWPGGPYGVFLCKATSWPRFGEPDPVELSAWANARLSEREGWHQLTDVRGHPRRGIHRRNDTLGVLVRVEQLTPERMLIEVQADYHGPPIIFDGPGPY